RRRRAAYGGGGGGEGRDRARRERTEVTRAAARRRARTRYVRLARAADRSRRALRGRGGSGFEMRTSQVAAPSTYCFQRNSAIGALCSTSEQGRGEGTRGPPRPCTK